MRFRSVGWASLVLVAGVAPGLGQVTATGYVGVSAEVFSNGSWSVTIPKWDWVYTGNAGAPVYALRTNSGRDNLGDFEEIVFDYQIGASQRTGSIRLSLSRPAVLFTITYNNASDNTAPFPSFTSWPALFHMSYSGLDAAVNFTDLSHDSPWLWFNAAGNAAILSPAGDFLTSATVLNATNTITSGISPTIASLPAGFSHRTLLAFGTGINTTFTRWGKMLTLLSGKRRPRNDAGTLLKFVSYWTDNGAAYYYNPGGTSYTETLDSIKAEFHSKGIQLRSLQLDSWFYPKGPADSWRDSGGIWIYRGSPALFEPDLAAFRAKLKLPLVAHARWIDANSPYRSEYTISGNVATDPNYWEMVASYLRSSGVATYEQDWLGTEAVTELNLTDPYLFLDGMADAMARHGLTMQYCMALPKHFLQASVYSNLTTMRASRDRFSRKRWTDFFYASQLVAAVGAWPFTDVFMSSETNNLIAAALSAGPVGVGDAKGALVKKNLLKAVRADGVIVKPDVPATPVDSVFVADAQKIDTPMIAAALTNFGAGLKAHYLFAYARGANTTITINPADFGMRGTAFLYDYKKASGRLIEAHSTYTTDLTGEATYLVLMPVGKTGIAFLGDHGNFVTLGKKRIASLSDTGRIDAKVSFGAGEKSRVLFGYSPHPVAATAVTGSVSKIKWDAAKQLFTMTVEPDAKRSAHLRIRQRKDN